MLLSLGSNGRSVSRGWMLLMVSAAQFFGPFSKPSWNANSRSKAVPCACVSAADVPALSRTRNSDESAALSPSEVDTVKYLLLPSATHR